MTADEKLAAFESLMGEASSAIADMAETIKAGQGTHDEIAATLADVAAALEARKALPLQDLIAAVRALRITAPAVNVTNDITVSPTPIQNIVQPAPVQIIERATPFDYKVTPSYDRHGVITDMLITRVQSSLKP